MILTITSEHVPATDLGYLLHKNPARFHSVELSFGRANVFFPEGSEQRCTAALFVEVDSVELVRGRKGRAGLDQYVTDRPYAASSFLSVAIGRVFGTALTGRSKHRPELAESALPLSVSIAAVPCRGGEPILRRLFEPLGYAVSAQSLALDEKFPEWGESRYFRVEISGTVTLRSLLAHLYVLLPVLDDEKHYWVGHDEIEKLLRRGSGWLAAHPERELITSRYLGYRKWLTREALARLSDEDAVDPDSDAEEKATAEEQIEEKVSLNQQRLGSVVAALRSLGARRVLDLGCGEGRLLQALLEEKQFEEITGVDASHRVLEKAASRLKLERMPPTKRKRIQLLHGALTYRDRRISGFDAAAVVEVIEHFDPPRLATFERVLFETAKPAGVVVTTPNAEYNVKFETLRAGEFRHGDHRFEWTREEFQSWANRTAQRFGYKVRFLPVGPEDTIVGAPTQMAVFTQ